MTLRSSHAWWLSFVAVPTYLIVVYPPLGLGALLLMAWLTWRSP